MSVWLRVFPVVRVFQVMRVVGVMRGVFVRGVFVMGVMRGVIVRGVKVTVVTVTVMTVTVMTVTVVTVLMMRVTVRVMEVIVKGMKRIALKLTALTASLLQMPMHPPIIPSMTVTKKDLTLRRKESITTQKKPTATSPSSASTPQKHPLPNPTHPLPALQRVMMTNCEPFFKRISTMRLPTWIPLSTLIRAWTVFLFASNDGLVSNPKPCDNDVTQSSSNLSMVDDRELREMAHEKLPYFRTIRELQASGCAFRSVYAPT